MNENDFCGIFHETVFSSNVVREFKDGVLISFAIILFKFLDWWYNWRFHVITLLTNLKSLVAFKHSESWKVYFCIVLEVQNITFLGRKSLIFSFLKILLSGMNETNVSLM